LDGQRTPEFKRRRAAGRLSGASRHAMMHAMCLIALAWNTVPDHPLLLVANRDEFHDRAAAPLHWWDDRPQILAGRDLREGGTWLGVSRSGRLAAVTNVRGADAAQPSPRSRGALVADFLDGTDSGEAFARAIAPHAAEFGGFNLLLYDGRSLHYCTNRPSFTARAVEPGVHGLSNASLDTPWPKVCQARAALEDWIVAGAGDDRLLLEAMGNPAQAPDDQLPNTGVGIELERMLSSAFIHVQGYGTRCTTAVRIDDDGSFVLHERRYDGDGAVSGETSERFEAVSHG
jgi:uncharacterized protein with NRDE domain